MKKMIVIGLDCADPYIIFNKYIDKLPGFKELTEKAYWGNLRSTDPPITVPAWMSMVSSKSPGDLGVYGFRNRKGYSYKLGITTSLNFKNIPKVWNILEEKGYKSGVISVPPAYPVYNINGFMLSCFLTPPTASNYSFPNELKTEIEKEISSYLFDARGFRTDDKTRLIKDIYELTGNRFDTVNYLLKNKPWDFFMFVEMGVDRIHHGFWRFFDETHPKYEKDNEFEDIILKYYQTLDKKIEEMISGLDDDTSVLIVSDHGAQGLIGGICLNEWLIKEGYLKLKDYPSEPARLDKLPVDWENTIAWGEGGYYGRLFINVKGREPQGTVVPEDYEKVRDELKHKLQELGDENGNHIGTVAYKPEELYTKANGFPPDLIIYFGNLKWRSIGSIGLNTIWTTENDTGPDDANHAVNGMYIYYNPGKKESLNRDASIYDIAPTILRHYNIDIPDDFIGTAIE